MMVTTGSFHEAVAIKSVLIGRLYVAMSTHVIGEGRWVIRQADFAGQQRRSE